MTLAARVAKLEAKHKTDATKVRGVIGGVAQLIVDVDKPGHLKFSTPPGGFATFARNQQNALQTELLYLFADISDRSTSRF